jgi:hypothetical protein
MGAGPGQPGSLAGWPHGQVPAPGGTAHVPTTPAPQAMQQIIAEIQELGDLDPAARDELLDNLKQTNPAIWPLVAQQVRASLAWRRQAAEREVNEARADVFAEGGGSHEGRIARDGRGLPQGPVMQEARAPQAGRVARPTQVSQDGRSSTIPARASQAVAQAPAGPTAAGEPSSESFPRAPGFPRYAGPFPATSDPAAPPPSTTPRHSDARRGGPRPSNVPARPPRDDQPAEQLAAYTPSPRETPTAHGLEPAGHYPSHLDRAIQSLESELTSSPRSDREFAEHAKLRMLYLLSGKRDRALRPIPSMAPAMQEFWTEEIYGLAALMESESTSDPSARNAEAKQHLDRAASKLGESCPLVVRNLAFVTDIQSFGTYKPFEKYEFVPGQRVLLYAEVENSKAIETPQGFHTATRSSYQIFDASGKRVDEHESKPSEEYCRRPRRDFFIVYDLCMPEQIYPGKHVLQLTVADLNSQKIGQSLIEFTIKSPRD